MVVTRESMPLVSIAVITFNSEKTVLETLDSIKTQDYQNIELIVSDDCSSDKTIQLCREWIDENKNRFVRTQIIEVDHNTGTAGNINRAEGACQGEWIKDIAGDDLLVPTCISDYIDFVAKNPETVVVFGKCCCFGGSKRLRSFFEGTVFKSEFFSLSAQEQYELLLKGNCIPASTVFINGPKMKELGISCDERIPLLEDWPRWLNLTKKGIKLVSVDTVTVKYRLNGISSTDSSLPSQAYYRSLRLFDYLYRYPLSCDGDTNAIVDMAVEYDCRQYDELRKSYNSKEYRIGNFLLAPLKKVVRLIRKVRLK